MPKLDDRTLTADQVDAVRAQLDIPQGAAGSR
jgi:hypothetical protein